jgi:hypothetical protein
MQTQINTASKAADGVEITPEMLESGCEVIWRSFNDVMGWGSVEARGIVIEVFEAMSRAHAASVSA